MSKFHLRESTPLDVGFVYQLRNDIETRKFMLRPDPAKRGAYMGDPSPVSVEFVQAIKPLIFTLDDKPIGYATVDIQNNKALLGWNIAMPFRNRGHGRALIKMLLAHVGDERTPLAMIKREDIASQHAAQAAGMCDQTERDEGRAYPVQTWGLDRGPLKAV